VVSLVKHLRGTPCLDEITREDDEVDFAVFPEEPRSRSDNAIGNELLVGLSLRVVVKVG
jgi:hypothetical protein